MSDRSAALFFGMPLLSVESFTQPTGIADRYVSQSGDDVKGAGCSPRSHLARGAPRWRSRAHYSPPPEKASTSPR
jgi:hypothetical protein